MKPNNNNVNKSNERKRAKFGPYRIWNNNKPRRS